MRILCHALLTLAAIPIQMTLILIWPRMAKVFPMKYHKLCTRIFGFQIRISGKMSPHRPTLFVSNHSSYLDIIVLGSIIPASFVSKSEVANWPVIGFLAKLQRTVFVQRKRTKVGKHSQTLSERFKKKQNLILFPEGTSTDGNHVLPFKSSFFSVALEEEQDLMIQPVSIAYTHLNRMPLGRMWRPYFCWYADMPLGPHLWRMLGLGYTTISVKFHPPVNPKDFKDRKQLAQACGETVCIETMKLLKKENRKNRNLLSRIKRGAKKLKSPKQP